MKKLILFTFLAISLMAHAQTITIGDETNISNQVPVNTTYDYSLTEQIFHADEIEYAGNINAIRYRIAYSYDNPRTSDISVFMKHVAKSSFSDPSDCESFTADNMVYSGQWTIPANTDGWISIEFDTPFAYNGTDNLLIAISEHAIDFAIRYFMYSEAEGSVLSYFSDDKIPDPYDLSTFDGFKELINKRPNIKLVFGGSVGIAENSSNALSAYPNPAKDVLYIDGADDEMVSVYDATGRLVMQEIYTGPLHIDGLRSGLYTVITANGTIRFIK